MLKLSSSTEIQEELDWIETLTGLRPELMYRDHNLGVTFWRWQYSWTDPEGKRAGVGSEIFETKGAAIQDFVGRSSELKRVIKEYDDTKREARRDRQVG